MRKPVYIGVALSALAGLAGLAYAAFYHDHHPWTWADLDAEIADIASPIARSDIMQACDLAHACYDADDYDGFNAQQTFLIDELARHHDVTQLITAAESDAVYETLTFLCADLPALSGGGKTGYCADVTADGVKCTDRKTDQCGGSGKCVHKKKGKVKKLPDGTYEQPDDNGNYKEAQLTAVEKWCETR